MYYSIELTEGMSSFIDIFKQIIFYGVILVILTLQSYEMLVCTAYSIGQRKSKNKMFYSVIAGIVLYFISQIISLIGVGLSVLIEPNYFELLESANIETIKTTLVITNVAAIISIVLYYGITVWSLNKKMDLE